MRKGAIAVAGVLVGSLAGFLYRLGTARDDAPERPNPTARQVVTASPIGGGGGDTPGQRRSPPRFVASSAGQPLETDPSRPGYDPTKLSDVGLPLPDIVAAEPRVASWAAPMEKMLFGRVSADLGHFSSAARIVGVECLEQLHDRSGGPRRRHASRSLRPAAGPSG